MEFIDTAYLFSIPLFLLLSLIKINKYQKYCINIIATANTVLILNSFFIIRQLFGFYYLGKKLGIEYHDQSFSLIKYLGNTFYIQLAIILMPVLFLYKKLAASKWLSVIMLILLFSIHHSFFFYSLSAILFHWLNYFCLMIGAYALLWLLKRLPFQSE